MKGARTRQSILERAVDLASVDGLEGLTIGRLAEDLSMSKSGLFAHFGSKEELQLAAIEAASERYIAEVFRPALGEARGFPRLQAICRGWLDYVRRGVFPGGCFFAAASFEFDGRPGPVRDAIVATMDNWIGALTKAIQIAKDESHLRPDVDPALLAFELNSLFFGANFAFHLLGDKQALKKAETAIDVRLRGAATPQRGARRRTTASRRRA
jgi:AcrR family transcriptional regulator